MSNADRADELLPPDPFLTITDLARHLRVDPTTVKKFAATQGLPIAELTEGKKGCVLSALNTWKKSIMRRGAVS